MSAHGDRQFCLPLHKLLDERKQRALEASAIVVTEPDVERVDAGRNVLCLALSGGRNDYLATGSADGKLRLYAADPTKLMPGEATQDALRLVQTHDFGVGSFVTQVGFASSLNTRRDDDGDDYLFAASQKQVKVFSAATHELVSELRTIREIKRVAFFLVENGPLLLATASRSSTRIEVFNPFTGDGSFVPVYEIDVSVPATCFAFRDDLLAVGSYGPAVILMTMTPGWSSIEDPGRRDTTTPLISSRQRLTRDASGRGGHTRALSDLRFLAASPSRGGREPVSSHHFLLSASEDRTCILWRVEAKGTCCKALRSFAIHTDFLTSCAVVSPRAIPHRFVIAASSADKSSSVCTIEMTDEEDISGLETAPDRLVVLSDDPYPVRGITLSSDGKYALTASNDRVRLYDLARKERINMLCLAQYVRRRVSLDATSILKTVWSMYV